MSKKPLALALCLAFALSGCSGGCGDDDPAPVAAPAVEAPKELLAEVWVKGTDVLLRGLAEQSQSRSASVLLPKTAGDLAGRLSGLPSALLDEIPVGAPLHLVVVSWQGEPTAALAIKVPPTVRLSAAIPVIEGGPHGSSFLFERPGEGDDAQVRTEGAVVWAPNAAALEALLPYLEAGIESEGAPSVKVVVPDGVVGGPLRSALEKRLDEAVSGARASLAAERAAHDSAPPYGDPEVALDALAGYARGLLAYLPDIGQVKATLMASPSGTDLEVELPVREGSPLAKALAAAPVGPAYGAAALPPSTAFAIMRRSGEAGPPALAAFLRAVAGERIGAEDSTTLAAVEAPLSLPAGAPAVTVLGGNRRGAFLAYARAAEGGPTDASFLSQLVSVPYIAGVLGAAMGCDEGAAPPRQDFGPLAAIPLCARDAAPYPTLLFRRDDRSLAFALSHRPDPQASPHPAVGELVEGLAGHTEGLFGSYPDAARTLEILDDRTLVALAIEPSRAFAAAALLDVPVLHRLAETVASPPIPAPTIVGLSTTDRGLRLRARTAPRGIDRFLELGLIVTQLMSPVDPGAAP